MASSSPLTGAVLIDCARANASQGLAIAAQQCGYGTDTDRFRSELKSACQAMNVSPKDLSDLVEDTPTRWLPQPGINIAPDAPDKL